MRQRLREIIPFGLLLGLAGVAAGQQFDRSVIVTSGGAVVVEAARAADQDRGRGRAGAMRLPPDDGYPTPTPTPSRPITKRYWADPTTHTIRRSNPDGSRIEVVASGVNAPFGLGYDPGMGQLVWTSSGDEAVQTMPIGSSWPTTLASSFEDEYAVEGPRTLDGHRVAYALVGNTVVRITQNPQSEVETTEVLLTHPSPEKVHGLAVSADGGTLYLGDTVGRMSQAVRLAQPQNLETLSYVDEVAAPDTKPTPDPVAVAVRAPAKKAVR